MRSLSLRRNDVLKMGDADDLPPPDHDVQDVVAGGGGHGVAYGGVEDNVRQAGGHGLLLRRPDPAP